MCTSHPASAAQMAVHTARTPPPMMPSRPIGIRSPQRTPCRATAIGSARTPCEIVQVAKRDDALAGRPHAAGETSGKIPPDALESWAEVDMATVAVVTRAAGDQRVDCDPATRLRVDTDDLVPGVPRLRQSPLPRVIELRDVASAQSREARLDDRRVACRGHGDRSGESAEDSVLNCPRVRAGHHCPHLSSKVGRASTSGIALPDQAVSPNARPLGPPRRSTRTARMPARSAPASSSPPPSPQ